MGLLRRLRGDGSASISALAVARDPSSDYWYRPIGPGGASDAGVFVNPDIAQTLSAVWQAVRIITEGLAMLPLITYRRLPRGKERATQHPLYELLRYQPNAEQTAFEWLEMCVGHVALRGNAYNRIVPGRRGFADQLVPLHPDRIRGQRLPSGALQYVYRRGGGAEPEYLSAADVMHWRFRIGDDGIHGISPLEYGARSFGTGIAADAFAGRYFKNGAMPSGVLKHPGELGEDAQERLKKQVAAAATGESQHGMLVLEEGLAWESIGLNPKQTQLLQTREFGIREVARWFNVPMHRLMDVKTPTHSSIEVFGLEQKVYTFGPWAVRIEQAVRRDLILRPEEYFVEFLFEALERADSKARAELYRSAVETGWMTRNEVRERENLNPLDGLDEPLEPLNMGRAGEPRASVDAVRRLEARVAALPDVSPRAALIAHEAARRVVRKEVAAATKAAQRFARNGRGWQTWVREFYADHAGLVAETLCLPPEAARAYADRQAEALSRGGLTVTKDWEATAAAALADQALTGAPSQEA